MATTDFFPVNAEHFGTQVFGGLIDAVCSMAVSHTIVRVVDIVGSGS